MGKKKADSAEFAPGGQGLIDYAREHTEDDLVESLLGNVCSNIKEAIESAVDNFDLDAVITLKAAAKTISEIFGENYNAEVVAENKYYTVRVKITFKTKSEDFRNLVLAFVERNGVQISASDSGNTYVYAMSKESYEEFSEKLEDTDTLVHEIVK